MNRHLNERALSLVNALESSTTELRIKFITEPDVSRVIDFGVDQPGGLQAGLELAKICLGGLAQVDLVPGPMNSFGADHGSMMPLIQVRTDHPLVACMGCQYGGWPVQTKGFFAIGSGPMRAARGKEKVLEQYALIEREKHVVGVLESKTLPELDVIRLVAAQCEVKSFDVTLCVASTRSQAGGIQVVARSIEATMHKLFELDADLNNVVSGFGIAPLPPTSPNDLTAIGRTNDAILYGGQVTLWVQWPDSYIESLGPKLPSNSSADYGQPFAEIFKASDHDFYKLDPMLFSAAQVTIVSTRSGNVFTFGETRGEILRHSFWGPVSSKA